MPKSIAPPHSIEAEESLLGAMLLSKDAIGHAIDSVTSEDFYSPALGEIFDVIKRLYSDAQPVDPVTVSEELKRDGNLDRVGGAARLVTLQANTPATTSAPRYAKIIADKALLRKLVAVGSEISEESMQGSEDADKLLHKAEALVFGLSQRSVNGLPTAPPEGLRETLANIAEIHRTGGTMSGLPTGFRELDRLLMGLGKTTLTVVGARPSMGKSAFALGIAMNAAVLMNLPVLFFSLEMSHSEVWERMLSNLSGVGSQDIRAGRLVDDDWDRITWAASRINDSQLFVDDAPRSSVTEVLSVARRFKARNPQLALVVIDYLQLMTGSGGENRQVEVSEISRGLKILARELETPVLALSQLSRGLESRADKRPMLADLRESGAIEQDADIVMFLYRDEFYNPETPARGLTEISIAKHRNGPTGLAKMVFLSNMAKFANLAEVA